MAAIRESSKGLEVRIEHAIDLRRVRKKQDRVHLANHRAHKTRIICQVLKHWNGGTSNYGELYRRRPSSRVGKCIALHVHLHT